MRRLRLSLCARGRYPVGLEACNCKISFFLRKPVCCRRPIRQDHPRKETRERARDAFNEQQPTPTLYPASAIQIVNYNPSKKTGECSRDSSCSIVYGISPSKFVHFVPRRKVKCDTRSECRLDDTETKADSCNLRPILASGHACGDGTPDKADHR